MATLDTDQELDKMLAARIRRARREMPFERGKHISQASFAEKLGVHWVTVSNWERGKSPPTVKNVKAISALTGKPLEFFLVREAGEPGPFPADAAA